MPQFFHVLYRRLSAYPFDQSQEGNWLNQLFSHLWCDQCVAQKLTLVLIQPCSRMEMIVATLMEPDKPNDNDKIFKNLLIINSNSFNSTYWNEVQLGWPTWHMFCSLAQCYKHTEIYSYTQSLAISYAFTKHIYTKGKE